MELLPHQVVAAEFLRARKRAILADPPRLGKTYPTVVVTLEVIQQRGYAVVVAPSSAKFVWRDAIRLFDNTVPILICKNRAEAEAGPPPGFRGFFIVSWGVMKDLGPCTPEALVIDECHRMQSKDSKRTKATLRVMAKSARVFALSGSVMNNKPANLWALLTGLKINTRSWYDFAIHFCRGWMAPWGFDVSGASNVSELRDLIKPHLLRRPKESVFPNYTPPEYRVISFDKPVGRQESKFRLFDLTELENPIASFEGLSEVIRETAMKKLPDAIDFISGLLDEEPDMKLVVFAYHTDVIAELASALKAYRPVTVVGATSSAAREAKRLIFTNKKACRLFIGNLICCAEAIDLSVADTCVYVETTWVPSILDQATARIENLNKKNSSALAYLLTLEASLDHYMLRRVLEKMQIIKKVIPNETAPTSISAPKTRARRAPSRAAVCKSS